MEENKFVAREGLYVPENYGDVFPNVFIYKELHDNQIQFWTSIPFKQGMISYVMIHDLDKNGKAIDESRRYKVVYDDLETNKTTFYDSVFSHELPLDDAEEVSAQA